MLCEVYILDAPYHVDRPFDYLCTSDVKRGDIVKVPFGKSNTLRLGLVTAIKDAPEVDGLKPVHAVSHNRFSLNEEMLGLCLFLKEHTLCTLGEAVRTLLPPGALTAPLTELVAKTCRLAVTPEVAEAALAAKGRAGIRSEGQRIALSYLIEVGSAAYELVRQQPGVTPANVTALATRGFIEVQACEMYRNPYSSYSRTAVRDEIALTPVQSGAYSTLESLYLEDSAKAALLYGVTGSGKTKVIMKMIDRTLDDGKSVIMLVPEISLTPQTVSIFCSRYGERVAVVHSGLSQGERLDAWRRIKGGMVDLVIGTRSAIFAPLENLGLIVIDEEHEHTYKSESDPKYHARDVAAYRCGGSRALMLLASATPSIESFYKAERGVYTLVPMRERYGGFSLPEAIVVDMREELRLGNTTPISQRLLRSLEDVYENEEQAIIFLNRRGYSSQVSCKSCGEVISCPRCSVSLTYHSSSGGGRLLCHLCGHAEPVKKKCPACSSDKLSFLGYGTQKLEGELEKYLPDMQVMRMDADTTTTKLAYDKMLDDFRRERADILLGTQMVAKGHDFPKVTLVGVALADTSLYVSDFRAAERTFSLLAQVIGRAGRAKEGGRAVIQTYSPYNETIRLACRQDYDKFYEGEIAIRRELSYPPFCDMVQLTMTSSDEKTLSEESSALSSMIEERLKSEYSDLPFIVYGPFEAQVYKLNEKYRMRTVIKCKLNSRTRGFFAGLLREFSTRRGVSLSVDLNPQTV